MAKPTTRQRPDRGGKIEKAYSLGIPKQLLALGESQTEEEYAYGENYRIFRPNGSTSRFLRFCVARKLVEDGGRSPLPEGFVVHPTTPQGNLAGLRRRRKQFNPALT